MFLRVRKPVIRSRILGCYATLLGELYIIILGGLGQGTERVGVEAQLLYILFQVSSSFWRLLFFVVFILQTIVQIYKTKRILLSPNSHHFHKLSRPHFSHPFPLCQKSHLPQTKLRYPLIPTPGFLFFISYGPFVMYLCCSHC